MSGKANLHPLAFYTINVTSPIYHDMIGMVMVAPIYLILLYAILGMARFNPHWELEDSGQLYSEKLGAVSKVYGQYALVSLGILGFVPTTFLEATKKMFEQRFAGPVGTVLEFA